MMSHNGRGPVTWLLCLGLSPWKALWVGAMPKGSNIPFGSGTLCNQTCGNHTSATSDVTVRGLDEPEESGGIWSCWHRQMPHGSES